MDGSFPHWISDAAAALPAEPQGLAQASAQDFEQAVAPRLTGMRACALRLTRNHADAEDLVQDALLRAYRFWSSYSAGTNLSAWLNRIVKNTFINGYRRTCRERQAMHRLRALSDARSEQARPESPADAGFSDGVEAALQRITPEFRAVLLEVAVNELSYGEAAERLGCPVGTVMSRLHRARRALAPELGDYARTHGMAG